MHNRTINFKIDTGSEVNIIPKWLWQKLHAGRGADIKGPKLEQTSVVLEAYGGARLKPCGKVQLQCSRLDKNLILLEFLIVDLNVKPIIGLPACYTLGYIKRSESLEVDETKFNREFNKEKFISENRDIFEGVGLFSEILEIQLKKNSIPIAKPARRVPLAIRDRLKEKLDKLEMQKIIAKINRANEWVNNLVIIEKPNKSLRLCLDPQELNKCIKREFYEIPSIDDIRSKLAGKMYYTVMDFKDGFYQIKLNEKSSDLTTFATPFGCYKFLRLPFGLNLAPEYFQKMNEKFSVIYKMS